jgi:RNA polymerase sigma factor FliA
MSSSAIDSSRVVTSSRSYPRATRRQIHPRSSEYSHSEAQSHSRLRPAAAQPFVERDQLAVKLLSLVRRVALEMRERLPQHVDLEDLSGAGVLGLLDAVRKFDARKHVKVETYARHRIRGAILDSLRELDTASRDMRRKNKMAEKTALEMQAKLGRAVTDEELAGALGISLKKWYRTQNELSNMGIEWMRPNHIPENQIVDEGNLPAKEDSESPFDACYHAEQRAMLNRAAALLPEREQAVLSLYYQRELTMKQIGEKLGIDESRVSQIHSAAVAHLRAKVRRMLRPSPAGLAPLSIVASAQAGC